MTMTPIILDRAPSTRALIGRLQAGTSPKIRYTPPVLANPKNVAKLHLYIRLAGTMYIRCIYGFSAGKPPNIRCTYTVLAKFMCGLITHVYLVQVPLVHMEHAALHTVLAKFMCGLITHVYLVQVPLVHMEHAALHTVLAKLMCGLITHVYLVQVSLVHMEHAALHDLLRRLKSKLDLLAARHGEEAGMPLLCESLAHYGWACGTAVKQPLARYGWACGTAVKLSLLYVYNHAYKYAALCMRLLWAKV